MKDAISGAVILTVASFISKILSAIYKVPLQNWTGDEGFYVYQQVYPIYGTAVTLSLTGLPTFLSRIIVEQGSQAAKRSILKRYFWIITVFSLIIGFFLHIFAPQIADYMGDVNLAAMIQQVSYFFLFIPVLALARGYFQSTLYMEATAVSQVVEQFIRIGIILLAAYAYLRGQIDLYEMGSRAMSGSWIAATMASLILVLAYRRLSRQEVSQAETDLPKQTNISTPILIKRLLTEGGLIIIVTSFMILLQLVDSFTVYRSLMEGGLAEETAMQMKGVYDRGQPIFQLGMVVLIGLTTSFTPILARTQTEFYGKTQSILTQASQSLLKLTLIAASSITVGLVIVMPYLNYFLFEDFQGLPALRTYVLAILSMGAIQSLYTILQFTHSKRYFLFCLFMGLLAKGMLNPFFVVRMGITGSSLSTNLSLILVLILIFAGLLYQNKKAIWEFILKKNVFSFLLKLGSSLLALGISALATAFSLSMFFSTENRLTALLIILGTALVGVWVFIYTLYRLEILTLREWLMLPFGKYILRGRK
jgi:PST family polysaccharide transporter